MEVYAVTARFIVADVFDGLALVPDGSVDLCITSPPFLALRSYLPADHPDKGKEIGSEPTPEAFIDTLLDVVEAITPKLAPHGSLVFELGDTYSGSGGGGGDYSADGLRAGQPIFDGSGRRVRETRREGFVLDGIEPPQRRALTDNWPEAKSLCLIPESFRWALVYGRNPFNGRETPRWRARNVIRWVRPNPPVGALGDKFRPGTSELVVACKSAKRYFDLDAVRYPHSKPDGNGMMTASTQDTGSRADDGKPFYNEGHPAGAPPLDWWEIPTEPYSGSHYATFPRKLLDRLILAMCPQRVCVVCGKPSRQITETLGWTDCGCERGGARWRRGLVLDPFVGSGTTLYVATAHGRNSIGIDIDARNAELARERCGMFLEVEYLTKEASP